MNASGDSSDSKLTAPLAEEEPTYTIEQLAVAAGVSVRTIRYYLHRGLLPPPPFRGRRTVYFEHHRKLLLLIERLQRLGYSLEAVAQTLEPLDPADVERALSGDLILGGPEWKEPEAPSEAPFATQVTGSPPAPPRQIRVWTLAPGLELLLDSRAPVSSRELARRILELHSMSHSPWGGAGSQKRSDNSS